MRQTALMRVILDTNVLISGLLIAQGAPATLLDAWEQGLFTLVACDKLIAELREVARRPFFRERLRASTVEVLAAGLRDFTAFYENLPAGARAPDPKDTFLLALAEVNSADFLVTGDKKLLTLKHHKSTRIVSPATMVEQLKQSEDSGE
jgi:uncharacterized protein